MTATRFSAIAAAVVAGLGLWVSPVRADDPSIFGGTIITCDGTTCTVVGGSSGGTSIILDLSDNGSNESTALSEIATTNDPDGIATEPSDDKLLLDFAPVILETELASLADLNTQLGTSIADGAHLSTSGSNNEILTDDGAGGIVSESNLTFDGAKLTAANSTNPAFSWGDGDTTIYEAGDDQLRWNIGGFTQFTIQDDGSGNGIIRRTGNGGFLITAKTPSATSPNLIPANDDGDTGLGHAAADQLSLIAGGAELVNIANDGTDHTVTIAGSATQAGAIFQAKDSSSNTLMSLSADGSQLYFNAAAGGQAKLDVGDNFDSFTIQGSSRWVALDDTAFTLASDSALGWSTTGQATVGLDVIALESNGVNPILALTDGAGFTDATPAAATLIGQSGSGTDIAGADLNIAGGQGTGSGDGGNVVIQTAPAGGSGSSLNALADVAVFDAAGYYYGEEVYGSMLEYGSANSITVATAGTYYGWTTVSSSSENGMTVDLADGTADHFTITEAGEYLVIGNFCFGGANNALVQGAVHVDGSINADSPRFTRKLGTAGSDISCAGISGVLTLAATEEVSMRFTSDTNGDTVDVEDFSLSIKRVSS